MNTPRSISRRALLASTAITIFVWGTTSRAAVIRGGLPWRPSAGTPPSVVTPGPWVYFTADEGAAMEAIADRLIPSDPKTPGGKDCGCAVFIDRQLASAYGRADGLYMQAPFAKGTPQQGDQSDLTPAQLYRNGLAALDRYARATYDDKSFVKLSDDDKDKLLKGLEDGVITLEGVEAKTFFKQLLANTQEGFFADPLYGGNKDMASWKMIGFPGARYDYRDWIGRHNETYPLPAVGIMGRSAGTRQETN